MRGKLLGDDVTDEVCSLYRKGMGLQAIAEKLEIGQYGVRSALRRRGVQMRKAGRPSHREVLEGRATP